MVYSIELTHYATEMLNRIRDQRVRRLLVARIDILADEPEKQGRPLREDMNGYRSVRAVGQRFRIVYRIDDGNTVVIVAAVGIRRAGDRNDVYSIAQRLAERGLL